MEDLPLQEGTKDGCNRKRNRMRNSPAPTCYRQAVHSWLLSWLKWVGQNMKQDNPLRKIGWNSQAWLKSSWVIPGCPESWKLEQIQANFCDIPKGFPSYFEQRNGLGWGSLFLQVGRHPLNRITDLLLRLHTAVELPSQHCLGEIPAKIEMITS